MTLIRNRYYLKQNTYSHLRNHKKKTSDSFPYPNKYSIIVKAIDIQCIHEKLNVNYNYKNSTLKNWTSIRNILTDKYLSISYLSENFAGWTPMVLYNNNNNNNNNNNLTKDALILTKNTTNAIYSYTNNVYSDISNTIDYKFKLGKSFDRWKLSATTPSQNVFHPNLDNGHIFNTYYRIMSPENVTHAIIAADLPKKHIHIVAEISKISDLLLLIEKYPLKPDIEYNINMQAVHNIKDPLKKLNNMIGMELVKSSIIDQILYYIQHFHKLGCNKNDFMHTVIYGPPGTGKTELAKYIGEIFSKLGVLKNNTFKKVTRSDLIAGYLGQTATKTRGVIESCLGGVLFVDEAYSLGNNERGDSFSKECIDTLCEALSDHKDTLMVIIAGYENELKTCFFDYNQGLESRFTWRFQTSDYNYKELYDIFIKKVHDSKWSISTVEPINPEWFQMNIKYFKYFGRNIETLFAKTKITHSRRVFCKPQSEKTVLIHSDIEKGFELYKRNDQFNNDKNNFICAEHMYL